MFKKKHNIDTLFALLLYSMFAMLSLLMVIIGSRIYKRIVDNSNIRSDMRMTLSYVCNKIRTGDVAGRVFLEEREGIEVLVLQEGEDEVYYETLLYFHDGYLKEQLVVPGDVFYPEYGENLIAVVEFAITEHNGLFTITSSGFTGADYVICVSKRT